MRILASVERWRGGPWEGGPDVVAGRLGTQTVAFPSGAVLLTGGADDHGTTAETAWLDGDAWRPGPPMHRDRYTHATAVKGERAWVVGGLFTGEDGQLRGMADVEMLALGEDRWTPLPPLPIPLAEPSLVVLQDGSLLATGGYDDELTAQCFVQRDDRGWEATSPLSSPRAGHTATMLPDGRVFVLGGCASFDLKDLPEHGEIWDPTTGTWTEVNAMPRSGHTATPLPDGRVLVIGGRGPDGLALASAHLWTPSV